MSGFCQELVQCNPKIEIRQHFKDGRLEGKYERNDESCAPVERGQFKGGEKDGKWQWYDHGREVYSAKFRDGKEVK